MVCKLSLHSRRVHMPASANARPPPDTWVPKQAPVSHEGPRHMKTLGRSAHRPRKGRPGLILWPHTECSQSAERHTSLSHLSTRLSTRSDGTIRCRAASITSYEPHFPAHSCPPSARLILLVPLASGLSAIQTCKGAAPPFWGAVTPQLVVSNHAPRHGGPDGPPAGPVHYIFGSKPLRLGRS